jgi:hypothetical protein
MLFNIPFTLAPLIVYNMIGLGLFGEYRPGIWKSEIFSVVMLSDGVFVLELGHLMIIAGLIFLFIELIKATRSTIPSIYDHGFSLVVFMIYLIEFIAIRFCAEPTFFILMLMALIDVLAGFTIALRAARRDYTIERDV